MKFFYILSSTALMLLLSCDSNHGNSGGGYSETSGRSSDANNEQNTIDVSNPLVKLQEEERRKRQERSNKTRSRPCYEGILEHRNYALKHANGIRDDNSVLVLAELKAWCESVLKYDPCEECSGECTEEEQEEHKEINKNIKSRIALYEQRLNTKKELLRESAKKASESYYSYPKY